MAFSGRSSIIIEAVNRHYFTRMSDVVTRSLSSLRVVLNAFTFLLILQHPFPDDVAVLVELYAWALVLEPHDIPPVLQNTHSTISKSSHLDVDDCTVKRRVLEVGERHPKAMPESSLVSRVYKAYSAPKLQFLGIQVWNLDTLW